MKQLRLSVKEHRLTNKYNPTFKKYDYTRDFDFENEDDIDSIYETVNLYVHTYYEYKDHTRNELSFKSASAIFLDFDGKDGHNDSTIAEFLDSDFSKTYNWFFYTSKSHVPNEQECFHVILPLDEKITDIDTLKSTYAAVFEEVHESGLRCDPTVRDGARLIFPSLNESKYDDDAHFDAFQFEMHHDGRYLVHTIPQKIEKKKITPQEKAVYADIVVEESDDEVMSDYLAEFKKMSLKSKYAYFRTMMNYLNTKNKMTGYQFLSYNKWIGIGFTLYKTFGRTKGRKLFRLLSKGHPRDSQDKVDRQFDYLCGCNYSTNKNIEILIQTTGSIGFRHTMYFRYYFMSKHRFNPTQSSVLYQRMVTLLMRKHGYDVPMEDVKLYDFSFKKNTRTFLMEIDCNGTHHITVRLGEMMDIMSKLLRIPRKFVTTSITKGVIRRFININGVYDITRYIKVQILTLLQSIEGDFVRVSDINNIMKDIRGYAPSTIQSLLTNKNIELFLFEQGVFTDKRKKRFTVDGSSKPYMGYKVDRGNIILPALVAIPKSVYYRNYEPPKEEVIVPSPRRTLVMRC